MNTTSNQKPQLTESPVWREDIHPVIPAVANAVYDAVGVRMTSLPITSEKVLKEMKRNILEPVN